MLPYIFRHHTSFFWLNGPCGDIVLDVQILQFQSLVYQYVILYHLLVFLDVQIWIIQIWILSELWQRGVFSLVYGISSDHLGGLGFVKYAVNCSILSVLAATLVTVQWIIIFMEWACLSVCVEVSIVQVFYEYRYFQFSFLFLWLLLYYRKYCCMEVSRLR